MATHGTPGNENVTEHDGAPDGHPPTAIPSPRPRAGGEPRAVRRARRALLAVRTTVALLITGSLVAVCLGIQQLAHHSVLAGVYVGLAGVGVAGVGACVPVYLHLRRKDPSDGRS
ncbi:hypothetical protein [Streptomyces sp. NPDC002588]|uniref:hypothetical protein n=1 Tax=Streptomyces sp. NPDC002588 TaxID=3154419 RepID=UPI0033265B71